MTKKHLVVMDVPGIKKYVFGTDRLVEIRGASGLLAQLNEVETPAFLEERLSRENVDCIFSGGGAGQFIITAELPKLEQAMEQLQSLYSDMSRGGLRLLYGISPYDEHQYSISLDHAFLQLKKKKDEMPVTSASLLHTGFIRECDSCAGMASQSVKYGGDTSVLCDACARKVTFGKKKGLWGKFIRFLEQRQIDPDAWEMPTDFEKIGEMCKARRGYTALIYADGNAMGKLIKQIRKKSDFQCFSQVVDQSITEACHEALFEICPPVNGVVPANILLLGGDDLLVYMTADSALDFAVEVSRRFTQKTKSFFDGEPFFDQVLQGRGLTVSLGIVYGKSHTPFSFMFSQAEELLKSAKQAGSRHPDAKDFYSPPFVDFHIITQFNQSKVVHSRKNFLQLNGAIPVKLYQKPYAIEDAAQLLTHAQKLIYSGIPRSRLKRMGYAPFADKMNGTLEFLKLYTRCSTNGQREAVHNALAEFGCVPDMPWKAPDRSGGEEDIWTSTMLVDLMEIVQFTTKNHHRKGGWSHASQS